ncbi:MAG: GMC family oxidoreductase [Myxococcales bacterium]|nr:GMC family oxidoreductase [Myxococcales bacterium]
MLRAMLGLTKTVYEDSAEVVIVGTGAGGATAARVLAAAGVDVLMLEEGPRLQTAKRPRAAVGALSGSLRAAGSQTTTGMAPIPLLQGLCVGGSTAMNSGIIWRMPEDVRQTWIAEHGLASLVDAEALERIYAVIEEELEVAETSDEVLGGNATLMRMASEALGLPGKAMSRNARRCEGKGECLQGCPGERRQSMDVSYVPRSIRDGARLETGCRVERVDIEGGRAVGVSGLKVDPVSREVLGRFRVRAQHVVVAAGVVHTPLVLQRSGLRGMVGHRFQAHPGAAIVGRFPEPVRMSYGATQGYEVPMRDRGFKLESLSLPPEMLAARLPGAGAEWQERIANLDHYAQWCAQVRMEAKGRITAGPLGPLAFYEPTERDLAKVQDALTLICDMMFEAGAVEVYPGIDGVPEVLRSRAEVATLREKAWQTGQVHLVASHLFGTAVAGADPSTSVVDDQLRAHGVSGLYVMDASVFPTNMGVNPQHSIMAVVWRAAEALAARIDQRAAA